ncbi:MAG: TonB-dependent receptor [Methylomonas sp.]|jgi:iron complex outermembrane receptor protein|uniref:TonB-dependent receptor plug domain-containing protein n=1 Tax=Methylomonas sp. TaxID=418 RepID=UPI0025E12E76|nr:TonB-dependent receptor [Methylomonas sp.]MCK9606844.1 TonB-dependent receptor [Methylomonas sp.]
MLNITKISVNYRLCWALLGFTAVVGAEEQNEALNLSVEDLLNVEVTSVAKKAQSLNDAAAAIFVISNEDIKRTGVTNIPDALRLAPGLDIAKINANQWAVSSRGFNGRFANKLLVLVDGRNAYARSFSGVYWENQDVMMEDIDRIEVIRGPGAALWGANAVNGVINIITKNSAETLGGLVTGGGGNQEKGFGSLRYGVKLGEDTSARAYVKGFDRNQNTLQSGGKAGDNWDKVQGGFRLDSQLNTQDTLTVQGDVYRATINQFAYFPQISAPYQTTGNISNQDVGGNLLGRFQHTFSPTSDYSLQFFYDAYKHQEAMFTDSRNTLDLQFQHRFGLLDWHEIIWGGAYNYGHDQLVGNQPQNGSAAIINLNPARINDQLASGFIQDEMTLIDNKLWLTIGSRFEHNDYSGFEGQPSAKVMWAPHNQHRLWAGVSRAVRTPSRAERYGSVLTGVVPPQQAAPPLLCPPACTPPVGIVAQGNTRYQSEEVIAYEAGYRTTFSKSVSLDVTGFYNVYRDLRFAEEGTPSFNGTSATQPLNFTNQLGGRTYGVEIATIWQMLNWWRWDVNYSWLHTHINPNAIGAPQTNISPQQRVSLRGVLSPWNDIDLDFWFRYVDSNFSVGSLGENTIKNYVTLDLRAAWRPIKDVELSVVGQNLLQQSHLEYISENQTFPTLIVRGLYGKISWNF